MITRIPGIQRLRKPNGKVYFYHRATRTRIMAAPHTPEFLAEVIAIEAKAAKPLVKSRAAEGTWNWLVEYWWSTPEWTGLKPKTQKGYNWALDWLKDMGEAPLATFTPEFVLGLRNKAFTKHKRGFANLVLVTISRAWNVGKACGKVPHANPVSKEQKVARPKGQRVVNRPWTVKEVETVLAAASYPLKVAISLALWAGWREGDVCRMTRAAYNGSEIEGRQGKTDNQVWMPAHSALRAVLDAELERLPRLSTSPLVMTLRGGGFYTDDGFRASFFKLIRELGLQGLTFHGLRVTLATAIAEAGGSTRDIAAALGHATTKMAEHYARHAERKKDAARAIDLLEPQPKDDV